MAYLEKIRLKGFKSIRELDLPLRRLNVLVGANGSGKSNLLAAFRLLNAIADRRLRLYTEETGAETLLYFGQKVTPHLEIELALRTEDSQLIGYKASLASSQVNTLMLEYEVAWFGNLSENGNSPRKSAPSTSIYKENQLIEQAKQGNEAAQYVLDVLASWQLYHFDDTTATAGVKRQGLLGDGYRLRPDASNLAAFLYGLQQQKRPYYDRIVSTIQMVVPFFEDFVLRPYPPNPDFIELGWRHKESDAYFNAHALSDGSLRFICLTTLLLQPDLPSLILLDEPELGLHPHAIALLASMLQSAAEQTQVIAATQSVTLVNQFVAENILVAERKGNESIFRWLDSDEALDRWLADYGLGELWEKNLFGGTQSIVSVRGG